jgi:hypothetical protein
MRARQEDEQQAQDHEDPEGEPLSPCAHIASIDLPQQNGATMLQRRAPDEVLEVEKVESGRE